MPIIRKPNRKKRSDRTEFRLTFFSITSDKRIARMAHITTTYWIVIRHLTTSVLTTCAATWIYAFLVYTCFVKRTFRTDRTFGAASWRRANIIDNARTNRMLVHISAHTVWATWWGYTGIRRGNWLGHCSIVICINDKLDYKNVWQISEFFSRGTIQFSKQKNSKKNRKELLVELVNCTTWISFTKKRYRSTGWKIMGHTNFATSNRRIAGVPGQTRAVRWVIGNMTFSIWSTNTRAWITTFIIYTGFILWTIIIINAFGATFRIGITEVSG